MAETVSYQERTEAPTPRRREEALREGRIARSTDLSAAVVLLAGSVGLGLLGTATLARHVRRLVAAPLASMGPQPLSLEGAVRLVRSEGSEALAALAPFGALLAGAVLIADALQARGVMSLTPLLPRWERVSPLAGIKRLFGLQALTGLVKSLLKLAAIATVLYLALRANWDEILALDQQDPLAALGLIRTRALALGVWSSLALLALALADYGYEFWRYERSLRMTKQEAKQELRETEGDPALRHKIRSTQRALARRRMLQAVRSADAVVTNPTEIAVALKYDPAVAEAPLVVAMGAFKLAQRIRELAAAAGVPIIENPPLARALFATGTLDRPIPPALYAAVAEVLAFVYRIRGRTPPTPLEGDWRHR